MRLGELIASLEYLPAVMSINGKGVSSYRGFYDHLAVIPGDGTVGELLLECWEAVGKEFQGYKGGDYTMTVETPVWYADRGVSTDLAVVGVSVRGAKAILETANVEAYW